MARYDRLPYVAVHGRCVVQGEETENVRATTCDDAYDRADPTGEVRFFVYGPWNDGRIQMELAIFTFL